MYATANAFLRVYTTPRTWHPHVYCAGPKSPTPHYIRNILNLVENHDSSDDEDDYNPCSPVIDVVEEIGRSILYNPPPLPPLSVLSNLGNARVDIDAFYIPSGMFTAAANAIKDKRSFQ
ncbi:unnamed protein product [Dimorphilus gyrociliatus]|uniref:Uncharacterized protein n=1 Tax=Dimorphilus gyrociliatus TaxID=2664684 RepID=A0A7I8VJK3_9ANNE|nr:unnamed protein product [Dimorphilus gyrociliatus]